MAKVKQKKWSNLELLTLGDLYREGKTYNEIATKLHRSRGAVAHAIRTYRDFINIEYRRDPDASLPEPPLFVRPKPSEQRKVEPSEDAKKPWWAFWRV